MRKMGGIKGNRYTFTQKEQSLLNVMKGRRYYGRRGRGMSAPISNYEKEEFQMVSFAIMCGLGLIILGSILYVGEIAFMKSPFYERIMNWFSPEYHDEEIDYDDHVYGTYDRIVEDGDNYVGIHRDENGWSYREYKPCCSIVIPEVIVGEEIVK